MVNSYTNTNVAVASSAAIPFNTNRYIAGCGSYHVVGSPSIGLRKCGYYLVNVNTVSEPEAAGVASIQLYNNGIAVPSAQSAMTVAAAGNETPLSFATIVRVLNSCNCVDNTANLTVVNTGLASTYTNAEISIVKLN